jgi:hypothetical protein
MEKKTCNTCSHAQRDEDLSFCDVNDECDMVTGNMWSAIPEKINLKSKINALISVIELTEHKVGLETLKEIHKELEPNKGLCGVSGELCENPEMISGTDLCFCNNSYYQQLNK